MLLAACSLLQALAAQALRCLHLLAIRAVPVRAWRLDERRQVVEPRLRQEHPKTLPTELTLAKVRVVVPVGAERDLRVVHVHADEALGSDLGVVLLHDDGQRLARRDVEAGREQMAAVQAGPKALAPAGRLDQLRELGEIPDQRSM